MVAASPLQATHLPVCPAHAPQGDPVKMQSWSIWGLPKDDVSAANAIIVFEGQRWPLCIDPQGQV